MENDKNVTKTADRLQEDNPTLETKDLKEGKPADLSKEVKQTPPEKPDFMPGAESKTPTNVSVEPVPVKNDSGNDEKTAVKQVPPEAEERPKPNVENTANDGDQQHGSGEDFNSDTAAQLKKNLDASREDVNKE